MALILHAALAAIVLIGYITLTALGDDGTALLAVLGGQALGAFADRAGTAITNRNGKP